MACQTFPQGAGRDSVDATEFRRAMRNLAGGVAIVATGANNSRRGLTVSSVTSLCMDPPCVLVGINASSETHDAILANGSFAINLLGNGQQDLALRFAGRDGVKGTQRFATASWDQGLLEVPVLRDAIGVVECELHQHQAVGTHGIFVGRIVATRGGDGGPLVNFQGALRTLQHS